MGYAQEAGRTKLEQALRSRMEQEAQKKCVEYAAKYSKCSGKAIILGDWFCSKQRKEFDDCMLQYCNDSVLEEMKHKYSL